MKTPSSMPCALLALISGPVMVAAEEPDVPSPFHVVETTIASVAEENLPTLHFADVPQNAGAVGKSRTHFPEGVIDPAGQRRLSSSFIGAAIRLADGTQAGRIADLIVGANGLVEFLVVEWNDQTYLLPYDVETSGRSRREWRLRLTADDLRQTAAFAGLRDDLSDTEYRERLSLAIDRAEMVWGLAKATREWSAAKPIAPPVSTRSSSENAATPSAPGLPVLAQPQAPAAPTQTFIVQPAPTGEATAAPAPATGTAIVPLGGVPVSGSRRPSTMQSGTGIFAPTSPSTSRFPNANTQRVAPGSNALPATIGGANPPRFTSAGGGSTVGGPTPQPIGPSSPGTQTFPAQTTVPGLSTPPPAGTSTTPSPTGTRYPARVP